MPASGSVCARVVARRIATAVHDVRAGRHGPGDDALVLGASPDSALARDPQFTTTVALTFRVVVMAVDSPHLGTGLRRAEEQLEEDVHHLLTIGEGVVLSPEHVGDVVVESGRSLPEVREVPIFEVDAILLCRPASAVDVHGCELVPDPSAPRVELGPDDVTLVETHFDVMVAGAERPQLFDRASLLLRRERVPTPPLRMVLGEPTFRCHAPSVVALTYPRWDATLDLVKQWVEAVGEILRTEVGLDCDHSASDVD